MSISPIGNLPEIGSVGSISSVQKTNESDGSFGGILSNAVNQANELYEVTQVDTQALLAGEVDDIAQVMINGTKASLAVDLVVQIRNKLVDAYNEFMRMTV